MVILIISNLFPPDFVGGYEVACCDMARGLAKRGHEVHVLTSGNGLVEVDDELCINRSLKMHLDYKTWKESAIPCKYFESHNYFVSREVLGKTTPDVVYIWSLSQVTLGVAVAVQEMGITAVYHIFDYSLIGFRQKVSACNSGFLERVAAWLRSKLRIREDWHDLIPIDSLQIENVIFGSLYLQNAFQCEGIVPRRRYVVYHGVDLSEFVFERRERTPKSHKLLFVGRLTPAKGVHVLLQAFSMLKRHGSPMKNCSLTIAGEGEEAYSRDLKKMIVDDQLEDAVSFLGKVKRERMPSLFREHDLFIFPSLWQEPFGIVIIEAMASGLPVVGTFIGGAAEILQDVENSIVCKPDDPADLAHKISLVLSDNELSDRIAKNAYNNVMSKFIREDSVAMIDAILRECCQSVRKMCG